MGRQENTKELFVIEALKLFSERGYDAVKISEIAEAVGCTAPALYKHYKNKQELYEAILTESKKSYEKSLHRIKVDYSNSPEERAWIAAMTVEDQIDAVRQIFLYNLHDEWASSFRKLMMLEQFHKKELAEMYDKRYIYLQYAQFSEIFKILIEEGKFREGDPYTMAVAYVCPIIVFIGVCDRDPAQEERALELLEKHVREFDRMYRIKD